MIISRGRRYIFVHIPKTGGTSMAMALEDRAMADDILIGDTPKAQRRRRRLDSVKAAGRIWKHMTLADAEGLVSRAEMRDFFVFTLVRNPWDRMVSYHAWAREQSFDHPAVMLAKSLNFQDFLKEPRLQMSIQRSPTARYVSDPDGSDLCNAYIRLEQLSEDLAPLEDHLGFGLRLPHVNASDRPADYRAAYDDETREIVARIAAEDIARFGYAF